MKHSLKLLLINWPTFLELLQIRPVSQETTCTKAEGQMPFPCKSTQGKAKRLENLETVHKSNWLC